MPVERRRANAGANDVRARMPRWASQDVRRVERRRLRRDRWLDRMRFLGRDDRRTQSTHGCDQRREPAGTPTTFFTVSQVRVVSASPSVFSISVMNTGPREPGT